MEATKQSFVNLSAYTITLHRGFVGWWWTAEGPKSNTGGTEREEFGPQPPGFFIGKEACEENAVITCERHAKGLLGETINGFELAERVRARSEG